MPASYGLVKEGLDNLMGIFGGSKKPAEILTVTPEKLIKQTQEAGGTSAVPGLILDGGPKILEAAGLDLGKLGKYAKYVLIGGAGLLAYSVLKK